MTDMRNMSQPTNEDTRVRRPQLLNERYAILKTLGKGNFGKVYLANDSLSGENVAVKVMSMSAFKNDDQQIHAHSEQTICDAFVTSLNHKNIVKVIEVTADDKNMCVVMEYVAGGELYDAIRKVRKLQESKAQKWFRELVEAVGYIHQNKIVHRDLKPENVLIDQDGHIRLCDFGFGRKLDDEEGLLKTYCGSPYYAAPEMVTATPHKGPPVDMWSCGVILYAMLTGKLPFQSETMPQLFKKISLASYTPPRDVSSQASNLISRLLCKNPNDRLTAYQCLTHPWLSPVERPLTRHLSFASTIISMPVSCMRRPSTTASITSSVVRKAVPLTLSAIRIKKSAIQPLAPPEVPKLNMSSHQGSSLHSSYQESRQYDGTLPKQSKPNSQIACASETNQILQSDSSGNYSNHATPLFDGYQSRPRLPVVSQTGTSQDSNHQSTPCKLISYKCLHCQSGTCQPDSCKEYIFTPLSQPTCEKTQKNKKIKHKSTKRHSVACQTTPSYEKKSQNRLSRKSNTKSCEFELFEPVRIESSPCSFIPCTHTSCKPVEKQSSAILQAPNGSRVARLYQSVFKRKGIKVSPKKASRTESIPQRQKQGAPETLFVEAKAVSRIKGFFQNAFQKRISRTAPCLCA